MTRKKNTTAQFPQSVPGKDQDLVEMARFVIGFSERRRKAPDKQKIEDLKGHLSWVASEVLICLQQQESSPSAKDLQKQLTRVSRLGTELGEAILGLPEFCRDLFNSAYHNQTGWNHTTKTSVRIDFGSAPPEFAALGLSASASHLIDFWEDGKVLGVIPPDRPGPQRAFQRLIDDPRIFLVDQVAQLIARERGSKDVTADEGGPVYIVVEQLWKYATGFEGEGANLRKFMRRGVRAVLFMVKWQALQDEKQGLVDERCRDHTKYMDPKAIADFNRRVLALDAWAHRLLSQAHAARWGYKPKASQESDEG